MKPFEERFTAWADGQMPDAERAAFEKELETHSGAEEDRQAAGSLGQLLREHAPREELKNVDFFNAEIARKIAVEEPRETSRAPRLFPLWRLATVGAFCLLMAFVLAQALLPKGPYTNAPSNPYLAEVLAAKPGSAGISAVAFHAEKSDVTVVWLDGLDYLPETYVLK